MSEDNLKEYLLKQARSLDSLLELTPAKHLFGEDVSDQWQKKKQTPEQKKAARLAKLDPANWKSVKDVYDERSAEALKKRKRENGEEEVVEVEKDEQPQKSKKQKIDKQIPTEKLTEKLPLSELGNKNSKKRAKKRAARMQKKAQANGDDDEDEPATPDLVVQPQPDKQPGQQKQQPPIKPSTGQDKIVKGENKPSNKQASAQDKASTVQDAQPSSSKSSKKSKEVEASDKQEQLPTRKAVVKVQAKELQQGNGSNEDAWTDAEDESRIIENSDDVDVDMDDAQSTASSSDDVSDVLSPVQDSAASSVSSIIPPPQQTKSVKGRKPATAQESKPEELQPTVDRDTARQRLQAQISQFRTQRKADDKPVKSRADLLAQRRQKELEKKAAKKEQRRKEREEEAKRQDEEIAKRFSPGGSGSLLASPRSPMIDDNGGSAFNFGRIAFDDGSAFDAATGSAASNKKNRGPADTASALKAAEAKQARISGLDDQKKADIAEKDMWLNAKKRAHGERVRDDTSLLKKALKRQEKNKTRSGKEWNDRIEGVKSSQEAKQKKRTENLQKRKDDKLAHKSGVKTKKVKRPGFEGSFRSRNGKTKK